MSLKSYILRLIRKVGPATYWTIMVLYAVLKLANEVLFYRCQSKITSINSKRSPDGPCTYSVQSQRTSEEPLLETYLKDIIQVACFIMSSRVAAMWPR